MNSLIFHQRTIQKFREEYLTAVPPVIAEASTISLEQRWHALFQCSIAPNPEWIAPEALASMLDLYQVSSYDQLLPKYLGNDEQWGAVVSPRVATTTGKPIAFIEHWFVTEPSDLEQVIEEVKNQWPFSFEAIWIPISSQHRCVPFIKERDSTHVQEYAVVADWGRNRPEETSVAMLSQYSSSANQDLDSWWPDFCGEMNREGERRMSEREINSLKKGVEASLKTGGIINLYDSKGFAAHVSWSKGSEAELLIPQCWNVPYIFVRDDLRGQELARHVYSLAAQNINLEETSLVCARVQAENQSSWKVLEAMGAERVMEHYIVFEK